MFSEALAAFPRIIDRIRTPTFTYVLIPHFGHTALTFAMA